LRAGEVNLTDHFTLEELSVTSHREFDNTPPDSIIPALTRTAQGLERIRTLLGAPIHVNSGYRSPEVNASVGSKPTSQHCKGEAADFVCPAYGPPAKICALLKPLMVDLSIDQLILEFNSWVHVSFSESPRRVALTIDKTGTHLGIA
jgi:hypothetical protein